MRRRSPSCARYSHSGTHSFVEAPAPSICPCERTGARSPRRPRRRASNHGVSGAGPRAGAPFSSVFWVCSSTRFVRSSSAPDRAESFLAAHGRDHEKPPRRDLRGCRRAWQRTRARRRKAWTAGRRWRRASLTVAPQRAIPPRRLRCTLFAVRMLDRAAELRRLVITGAIHIGRSTSAT